MEDAVAARPLRGIYAISDGASESYDSATWAKLLVRLFVERPNVDPAWLDRAVAVYNHQFDREAMSWSAQAAFDRGSYATLTGVLVGPNGRAKVIGIGDSAAILASGDNLVRSFPYDRPEQFRRRPLLLSTIAERNGRVFARPPSSFICHWNFRSLPDPAILLMTDAMAAWMLAEPPWRLPRLLKLRTRRQFSALVESERRSRHMNRDDTTLLIIR
jgi:hypothetical protein